jgi:hypothetical protein
MQARPVRAQGGNELQRTQHHEQESGNNMEYRQQGVPRETSIEGRRGAFGDRWQRTQEK